MTRGTSAHGGGLCRLWPDAGQQRADLDWQHGWWPSSWTAGSWTDWRPERGTGWRWLRRTVGAPAPLPVLSAMAGLAVGLMLTTTWHLATDTRAHLAVLLAAGAATACITLRPRHRLAPPPREGGPQDRLDQPRRLLAQMHHELRTPLNAVIGFSEVMRHELHGPLGHARYQEYAAHISESGGRLLKACEDALAVAEAMSVLLADRHVPRRQRRPAARLVEQAWEATWEALAPNAQGVRLRLDDRAHVEIACEGRLTQQALQHLLAEAAAGAAPSGAVIVRSGSNGGEHAIEIAVEPSSLAPGGWPGRPDGAASAGGSGLRLMLAQSLIEMQGGTLDAGNEPAAGRWWVRVAFPAAPARASTLRSSRAAAGARRRAVPARPGGSAAAAAARANAGSRAAPAA
jgi:signal transduction histidine kinase